MTREKSNRKYVVKLFCSVQTYETLTQNVASDIVLARSDVLKTK